MNNTLIVGAGRLGSAMTKLLSKKTTVHVWDKAPGRVPKQQPLDKLAKQADFVFLCVPSWALIDALAGVLPYLKPGATLVSFSKGIEKNSGERVDQVLHEVVPAANRFVLVGGPMLAEELAVGMGGVGVAACHDRTTFQKLASLFKGTCLKLEYTPDTASVALAGVMKNIYAVALGLADGLGWGGNLKGWLASLAIREMLEIVSLLGGKASITEGDAGIGDFIATAFSPYSQNRCVGAELSKAEHAAVLSEGVVSLPFIVKNLGAAKKRFPLLCALEQIEVKNKPVAAVFEKLAYGR